VKDKIRVEIECDEILCGQCVYHKKIDMIHYCQIFIQSLFFRYESENVPQIMRCAECLAAVIQNVEPAAEPETESENKIKLDRCGFDYVYFK